MNLFQNSLYPRTILESHAALENYEKTSPKIDLQTPYLVRKCQFYVYDNAERFSYAYNR